MRYADAASESIPEGAASNAGRMECVVCTTSTTPTTLDITGGMMRKTYMGGELATLCLHANENVRSVLVGEDVALAAVNVLAAAASTTAYMNGDKLVRVGVLTTVDQRFMDKRGEGVEELEVLAIIQTVLNTAVDMMCRTFGPEMVEAALEGVDILSDPDPDITTIIH
jgi:hypothetical protein